MSIRFLLAGTMVVGLVAGMATAQAATAPAVPPAPATPPSAHPLPTLPEKIAPPAGTKGDPNDQGKADNQGTDNQDTGSTPPNGVARGVVRPPAHVDPGSTIKPPAPQHFTMPVIPPPGTPGNAPQVKPK